MSEDDECDPLSNRQIILQALADMWPKISGESFDLGSDYDVTDLPEGDQKKLWEENFVGYMAQLPPWVLWLVNQAIAEDLEKGGSIRV